MNKGMDKVKTSQVQRMYGNGRTKANGHKDDRHLPVYILYHTFEVVSSKLQDQVVRLTLERPGLDGLAYVEMRVTSGNIRRERLFGVGSQKISTRLREVRLCASRKAGIMCIKSSDVESARFERRKKWRSPSTLAALSRGSRVEFGQVGALSFVSSGMKEALVLVQSALTIPSVPSSNTICTWTETCKP